MVELIKNNSCIRYIIENTAIHGYRFNVSHVTKKNMQ